MPILSLSCPKPRCSHLDLLEGRSSKRERGLFHGIGNQLAILPSQARFVGFGMGEQEMGPEVKKDPGEDRLSEQ